MNIPNYENQVTHGILKSYASSDTFNLQPCDEYI